jgi:hypothetical protein
MRLVNSRRATGLDVRDLMEQRRALAHIAPHPPHPEAVKYFFTHGHAPPEHWRPGQEEQPAVRVKKEPTRQAITSLDIVAAAPEPKKDQDEDGMNEDEEGIFFGSHEKMELAQDETSSESGTLI